MQLKAPQHLQFTYLEASTILELCWFWISIMESLPSYTARKGGRGALYFATVKLGICLKILAIPEGLIVYKGQACAEVSLGAPNT